MSYLYQCDNCYEIVPEGKLLAGSECWHCDKKGRLIFAGADTLENIIKNIIESGNELLKDLPDPMTDNVKWLSAWIKHAESKAQQFGMR
jgi:hypothetical protein